MNANENNDAPQLGGHDAPQTPPAGGFGAPPGPVPFGPVGGWGPMQSAFVPPQPVDKLARMSLYLGIGSIPGIFLCNVIGLPAAIAAVCLGIASLHRSRGKPNAPER